MKIIILRKKTISPTSIFRGLPYRCTLKLTIGLTKGLRSRIIFIRESRVKRGQRFCDWITEQESNELYLDNSKHETIFTIPRPPKFVKTTLFAGINSMHGNCFNVYKNQQKFISKLVGCIFGNSSVLVTKVFKIANHIRKTNGLLYMYKYMKTSRLHITRYISGKPLASNSDHVSVTNGGPTKFLFLRPLLKDYTHKRLLLTLMCISKGIEPQGTERRHLKLDFSSITDKYKGKRLYFIPRYFIDVMRRKYHISGVIEEPGSKTFFLNMKSSPTGISIISVLPSTMIHGGESINALMTLSKGGGSFFKKAYDYALERKEFHPSDDITGGKLSVVHDAEGKERVIAMLDYGSQGSLKPIHDDLLSILKRIPMDRTFTQDPFNNGKDDGNKFHSLDLSSATDRFPLYLQRKVISAFYGKQIGEAGSNLLVERVFSYFDKIKEKIFYYSYAVGQPMGSYSSWASFTLCHHFVVQGAAYKCGHRDFRDYIILGDDIVIKNDRVAQVYCNLMKIWGVDISEAKTHVSKDTYEFAKRWIHKGQEISPLPMKGVMRHFSEPKTVLTIVGEYLNKSSFILSDGKSAFDVVKESYKGLYVSKQGVTAELIHKRLYDFWIAFQYIRKIIPPADLKEYVVSKGVPVEYIPEDDKVYDYCHRIINIGLSVIISRANKKIVTLYDSLIEEFWPSERDKDPNWDRNLLSGHPLLHALTNLLTNLDSRLENYSGSHDDLKSLLDFLVIPGVNEVIHLKRQVRKEVTGLDKAWNLAFFTFVGKEHYTREYSVSDYAAKKGSTGVAVSRRSLHETCNNLISGTTGNYTVPKKRAFSRLFMGRMFLRPD